MLRRLATLLLVLALCAAIPRAAHAQEERVTMKFHGPDVSIPELTVLDGAQPRIVLDVTGVDRWNAPARQDLSGQHLTRLTSAYRRVSGQVQVVIGLRHPPSHYTISTYYDVFGDTIAFVVIVAPRSDSPQQPAAPHQSP
ncbi:hypothetical protein [Desulfobaculum sp.]